MKGKKKIPAREIPPAGFLECTISRCQDNIVREHISNGGRVMPSMGQVFESYQQGWHGLVEAKTEKDALDMLSRMHPLNIADIISVALSMYILTNNGWTKFR